MSKHTVKYWESKLRSRTDSGGLQVRIQFGGKQNWWPLGTGEKATAATKARDIWLSLISVGLEKTLEIYKPKAVQQEKVITTVGDWLRVVKPIALGGRMNAQTFETYAITLRMLSAALLGILWELQRNSMTHKEWAEKAESLKLAELTNDRVKGWMRGRIDSAGNNPQTLASTKRSLNSYLTRLQALFSEELIKELPAVELPDPPPFRGIAKLDAGSCKYVSTFNANLVLIAAKNCLRDTEPEQYKCFLLALFSGLRKHEIDLLEWRMIDFDGNRIVLTETDLLSLKTNSSSGAVDVPPELCGELRSFMGAAKSRFVIASDKEYNPSTKQIDYRCESVFNGLAKWLRDHGVNTLRPIHTLRKEGGSNVCAESGIFAAQQFLRHSTIATTAAHYVDKRKRYTVNFTGLKNTTEPGGMAGPPLIQNQVGNQ